MLGLERDVSIREEGKSEGLAIPQSLQATYVGRPADKERSRPSGRGNGRIMRRTQGCYYTWGTVKNSLDICHTIEAETMTRSVHLAVLGTSLLDNTSAMALT